jgi:hypothetical protein
MMEDEKILEVVTRLSRRHASGGSVIERAAILAEGAGSQPIIAWIVAHEGEPEAASTANAGGGLHGGRMSGGGTRAAGAPQRSVLPPGALS